MRPRYPEELFDNLVAITDLVNGACILEVGAGSGIATLPLAARGFEIVALELGEKLAKIAHRDLAGFPNVRVEVGDFETWPTTKEAFDLVISATAWHWIDPVVAYVKADECLRPGGHLAILEYRHIAGGDQKFFEKIQDCYLRYMDGADPDERLVDPNCFMPDTRELERSGLFEPPWTWKQYGEITYKTEEYLALLATYSGHMKLSSAARDGLFSCIGQCLDEEFGVQISKGYMYSLVVAKNRR